MENKLWYAVQKSSDDDLDSGSYDYDESKAMLKKQGYGLIAFIREPNEEFTDWFCEAEEQFDDLFDMEDFTNDELAEIVHNSYDQDEPGCVKAMDILCARAGDQLRKKALAGEDCTEIYYDLRHSVIGWESWFKGTPDCDDSGNDLIDWLSEGAERAVKFPYLAGVIENILDVDLGI